MIKTERNVARRATGGLSLAAVALLTAACLPISTAKAATITETYDFTATGPSSSPVTTWDGSFTITFDPTVAGGPFALDAFSSNLPASYNPFEGLVQASNEIAIGDNCNSSGCAAGPNQAFLFFSVDNSGKVTSNFFLAINTEPGSNESVTLASTPLPAALPLFASGLGVMGLFGWRRKRNAQAVAA